MKAEDLKIGEIYKVKNTTKPWCNIYRAEPHRTMEVGMVLVYYLQIINIHPTIDRITVQCLDINKEHIGNDILTRFEKAFSSNELLSIIKPSPVMKHPQLKDNIVVEISDTKYLYIDGYLYNSSNGEISKCYNDYKWHSFYTLSKNNERVYDKNILNTPNNPISKVYKLKSSFYPQLTGNDLLSLNNLELIWESEPIKTMTQSEIEKELGYKIKIDFLK